MNPAQLKLVPPEPAPKPTAAFIGPEYARLRSKDWARIHIRADRREPIDLGEALQRQRGNRSITIRPQRDLI